MYSNDKATQILIAMLKKYGISKIVVSPGSRNSGFAGSIQNDPDFCVYSVIDERSAAYFATGLSFETNEPVVIACTGATASRNYLPGLTEAFYRKIPIICLTFGHEFAHPYNLTPQYTDRSISQNDIKLCSMTLPTVVNEQTNNQCQLFLNIALTKAITRGGGPVHIQLLSHSFDFDIKQLPRVNKVNYYSAEDLPVEILSKELSEKKIGIFVGSHKKFSASELSAMEGFVASYDVAVFVDHTSNYNGINKILISQVSALMPIDNCPGIMIDIGGVSGDYSAGHLFRNCKLWRISEDGELMQRHGHLSYIFDCKEKTFFNALTQSETRTPNYYNSIISKMGEINATNLPLSAPLISFELSKNLPQNSVLHLSILNSLRAMDMFNLDGTINSIANVGGFGIDGSVSTLIGQSMADKNKLYFGQIGDLAFFYDMNALGIRHIGKNLRILLVNNGLGVEFRLSPLLTNSLKAIEIDNCIAARGHNGSARNWAESMGFYYISAQTKEEFLEKIGMFCNSDVNCFERPVLFEVFTTPEDEVEGLKTLKENNKIDKNLSLTEFCEKTVSRAIRKIKKVAKTHLDK